MPETGMAVFRLYLNATSSTGFLPGEYRVDWNVKTKPPYARTVLNPPSERRTVSATNGSTNPTRLEFKSELVLNVTRDAPAFKDDEYVVTADFLPPESPGSCPRGTGEGARTIKNDYLPLTQVNPQRLFLKVGPGDTALFPVEVSNLGNGPTVVRLTVEQPFKNKLEAVNAGAEIHLESRASRGPAALFRASRTIEAEAPKSAGYVNSVYQFTVKFGSEFDGAAPGFLQTKETQVTFSVQVQGAVGVPAPAASAILTLLAVIVLSNARWALLRRT